MKKQILLNILRLTFILLLSLPSLNAFDFDNFFNSLFDEKERDSNEYSPRQTKSTSSPSGKEASEILQEISTKKKDNFLTPLKFTQDKEDENRERTTAPTKIKVPQEKKDAYLYYTQKLIDFLDIIRSHLDLSMKEQTSEFLSLSHSITTDILSIDKQYLLKTFFHKDFTNLRKKIYQSLTKKSSALNLRNIIQELQKLKELETRSSSEEEAEERLTFEHNPHLSEKKRNTLIKQINSIATKELKPILESLEKLPFHEYATAEKNKKMQQNKTKKAPSRSYRGNSTWRPSYQSGSNRRTPYYNNRRSSTPYYNDSYGDGYYPSYQSSAPATPPTTSPSSTPSSSNTTSPRPEKEKEKNDDNNSLENKIENLLNGFGKEITQAIHALAQEKGLYATTPVEQANYLFDKKLGILIDHPQIEQYFAQINTINQMIHTLETNAKKTTKQKTAPGGTPALQTEQIKKYKAFKKPLALALCRAKNAFCDPLTINGSRFPPEILFQDGINFNKAGRFTMIKQALDELEPTFAPEIKKRTAALEALNKKYDDHSILEFQQTIAFLNEYNATMEKKLTKIEDMRSSTDPEKRKKSAQINKSNEKLKALIQKTAYTLIKKSFEKELALFIDTSQYPNYPVITEAEKKEILIAMKKIILFHWQHVYFYYDTFTKEKPTKKISENLPLLKNVVKEFIYKTTLINNCINAIDLLINDPGNAPFKAELEVFKAQELGPNGKTEIERIWGQTIKP